MPIFNHGTTLESGGRVRLTSRHLESHEIGQLIKDKFLRVQCECGHELFVWANTNKSTKLRARCLGCEEGGSYSLVWLKLKWGWKTVLLRYYDNMMDWGKSFEIERSEHDDWWDTVMERHESIANAVMEQPQ